MNQIFLLGADGVYLIYDQDQVRRRLESGDLSREMYCWREGMAEWRPLGELFPPTQTFPALKPREPIRAPEAPVKVFFPPPPPEVAAIKASRPKGGYFLRRSLEPWTTILLLMIVGCGVCGWYVLQSVLGCITALTQKNSNVLRNQIWEFQYWSNVFTVVWLVTAVFFVIWTYRVSKNARGLGRGLRFKAGLAAWSYFIPFLNLVYPYLVIQEVWKVSTSPRRWQSLRGSFLVGCWWGVWIIVFTVSRITAFTLWKNDFANLESNFYLLVYLEIGKIILDVLAFAVILRITMLQKRLVLRKPAKRRPASSSTNPAPPPAAAGTAPARDGEKQG